MLLIGGLLLIAAGSVLIAASRSLELLIAARVIQGVGSAASWISALALVSDTAPPGRRGESIGAALAATGVGSIAGPALGGVAADVLSYEAPFLIVSGLSLALIGAAVTLLPRGVRRIARRPLPRWRWSSARCGRGTRAGPPRSRLTSAAVLGLVEVVAPLDLDERLGLSAVGDRAALRRLDRGGRRLLAARRSLGRSPRATQARRRRYGPDSDLGRCCWRCCPGWWAPSLRSASTAPASRSPSRRAVPWLDEAFEEGERGLGYGVQNLLYAAGYAVGPVIGGWLLELAGADVAYLATAGVIAVGTMMLLLAGPAG